MKLGISCATIAAKYGYEKAFALIKESGFDAVEINLERYGKRDIPEDIYNASQDEFESFFSNIKRLADSAGLEISSTHGRGQIYTPDEDQCRYAEWACEKDLLATRILGAPTCVIHSIVNSNWPDRYDDEDFLYEKNAQFFRYLFPFAKANNVKIGLETYGKTKINDKYQVTFFAHAKDMKKQFDMLDTEYKTVCVDTGHTNEAHFLGAPSPADMIRTMGKDVTVLHLHDNNGTADLHLPPISDKRGGVDWVDVFEALDEIGYDGVYNFELVLRRFGDILDDAVRFLGKYLRYFIENKGRVL